VNKHPKLRTSSNTKSQLTAIIRGETSGKKDQNFRISVSQKHPSVGTGEMLQNSKSTLQILIKLGAKEALKKLKKAHAENSEMEVSISIRKLIKYL